MCQGNQDTRVRIQAAQNLLKQSKGTARSTGRKQTEPTRSTEGTKLYAAGTDGHGHVFVQGTFVSIRFVRSALREDKSFRSKKSTTSDRWLKEVRTTRTISSRFASRAIQASMRSVVTGGERNRKRNCKAVPGLAFFCKVMRLLK